MKSPAGSGEKTVKDLDDLEKEMAALMAVGRAGGRQSGGGGGGGRRIL